MRIQPALRIAFYPDPVTRLTASFNNRIQTWLAQWRAFKQSFEFPSALESRARSQLHNRTRFIPWRPLHHAAYRGRRYYVETLLQKYPVNSVDVEKVTPLHCAALKGSPDTLLALLAANANVHAKDMRGQTPLYWAAYAGNTYAVQLFIRLGADVNQADDRGKTPLRAAAKYGRLDAALSLLASGAKLEAFDGKKQTPYFVAAYYGRMEMMNVLCALGAETSVINIDGKNATQACARASYFTYFLYRIRSLFHLYYPLKDEQEQALRQRMRKIK